MSLKNCVIRINNSSGKVDPPGLRVVASVLSISHFVSCFLCLPRVFSYKPEIKDLSKRPLNNAANSIGKEGGILPHEEEAILTINIGASSLFPGK